MRKLLIPKSFQLMGQTITTEWQDGLIQRSDATGLACYRDNKILLQKNTDGTKIPDEYIEETFFHELMHFIANQLGESELRGNEKLIGQIAGLLHQSFKTAIYDVDTER